MELIFRLARLAQAKPGSDYILSDINFLKAPIQVRLLAFKTLLSIKIFQIWDQNTGARVPFTLYIVDASSKHISQHSTSMIETGRIVGLQRQTIKRS